MFSRAYRGVLAAAAMAAAMLGVRVGVEAPAERRYSPMAPPEPRPVARPRAERNKPRRRSHGTSYWKPNGAQECARRVRQIERRQLNICNGLVIPGLRYLGHGRAHNLDTGFIISVP